MHPSPQLGNHDVHRVGSRYGSERIDSMNMLLLTLPGVAITYNVRTTTRGEATLLVN